jgi:hypothetical protein
MMNRTQLSDGSIKFQDFTSTSKKPYVGEEYEVPMNAWGSTVARYRAVSVDIEWGMFTVVAQKVS